LQYRWDFDGDGSWETGWLVQDTTIYIYSTYGDYTPKLSVLDLNNLTEETLIQITVNPICTDIDGNTYQVVKIGNQWWMAENLKVTRYRNGDQIIHVWDDNQWIISNYYGAYCNYNNDPALAQIYGRLYNWYAVNDVRNLAPTGWHIPTDTDWQILVDFLGGDSIAGGKMKDTTLWVSPNMGATNSSGFSALPGGYRSSYPGSFNNSLGYNAYFWSATQYSGDIAWRRLINYSGARIHRGGSDKLMGQSIRCVKD
jgi:uncharacterized protein (TIGR02145 family)